MREPRLWIRVLWIWWSACCLSLLALWGLTLSNSSVSLLAARQLSVEMHVRELSRNLSLLQSMQVELLRSLHDDALKGSLNEARLARTRKQAEPYCSLYWIHADSSPVLPHEMPAAPWILALSKPRLNLGLPLANGSVILIRPLPPGMEAGRLSAQDAADPTDTPADYLILCAAAPRGTYLLCNMNLDYVLGPWLKQQVQRFGLGPDVSVRTLDRAEHPEAPKAVDEVTWLSAWQDIAQAQVWRWRIHSFLAEDAHPFGTLEITADNRVVLGENLRVHLLALAGGVVLLFSFALTIHLASRGVGRELAFAEARSRFTAMVSHELRTPIAAIKMYAEILENQLVEDTAKIASYHKTIGSEAGRLSRLVESLLEVGALERGQRSFQLRAVDVNDLISRAAQSQTAPEEPLELLLSPDLPPARADSEAVLQVLDNLIHNARKYASHSKITVVSRRTRRGLAVDVIDRGPGIPEPERRKIFQPYHRVNVQDHNDGRGRVPGVGLGLALVKGFMEGQGGSVEFSDNPEGGSIFSLHFRLHTEPQ